eukprot:2507005-Prymnesium_polylepis.1
MYGAGREPSAPAATRATGGRAMPRVQTAGAGRRGGTRGVQKREGDVRRGDSKGARRRRAALAGGRTAERLQ